MKLIFFLFFLFQVKHFLCDYPLQTPYMLKKGSGGLDWVLPLAAHSAVHAVGTLAIAIAFSPSLWWLALVDFAVHFVIDRVKAAPQWGGRWNPSQPQFWWALGADQAAHHICHFAFIALFLW